MKQDNFKVISHEVTINHPGEEQPVNAILEETQNEEGFPVQYSMDVYSVICLEQVCKVIPVKLYWNEIGEYQKYELAEGKTLEKYEADPFEPDDYVKIQSIMANSNSPFKDVYYDEILTVPNVDYNEDVDAVSGATALKLDKKDTVTGAALTCYTLWHWANGEVVSKIKTQTGKSVSLKQLHDFILNKDSTYFYIALNELKSRKISDKGIIDTIIKKILDDGSLLKIVLKYLEGTSNDYYFYATECLFFVGGREQKLAIIQALRETSSDIPNGYLDKFSSEVQKLNSYQEVSLFLGLMESKNPNSQTIIQNTLPLLNRDFLIARRSYWFLKNQELNKEQLREIQMFYEKNKNKL